MDLQKLEIRASRDSDLPTISKLLDDSFGGNEESILIAKLMKRVGFIADLSLVALIDQKIVGYILFSPIKIKMETGVYESALALAPMAIDSLYQRLGIGSKLIDVGHTKAKDLGYCISVVLGHADYYPKFGYLRASGFNIGTSFQVPEEAYMVHELVPGQLAQARGMVEYPPEFHEM